MASEFSPDTSQKTYVADYSQKPAAGYGSQVVQNNTASYLSAAVQALSGIPDLINSLNQASALRTRGEIEKIQGDINQRLIDFQLSDLRNIEAEQERNISRSSRQRLASQRAAAAAQGVDIGSSSFQNVQSQERLMTAIEISNLRNQARRSSFGLKSESLQTSFNAEQRQKAYNEQAAQSLIAGGISAARGATQGAAKLFDSTYSASLKKLGASNNGGKPIGPSITNR